MAMTKSSRATSIHRHLAGVGALTTGVVGGLFLLVLVGVSLETSRAQVLERSSALGGVLASNLTASIVFQDPGTAAELLNGLRTVEDVIEAQIILPEGEVFVAYRRSLLDDQSSFQGLSSESLRVPVLLDQEQIAALEISVDLWPVYQQLVWISGIAFVLWLLGMVAAYVLSRVFNARITEPLADLADMMSEVTDREDYSQRFSYGVNNELGSVVDAFNEMLERIGDREQRLRKMILELEEARDQAESAARSKSSFLANMSHEIRTPMNGVMGMIALLKQGGLTQQQRAYFETIERSADALLLIIDDILDFTKIEAGRLKLGRSAFGLRESLGSIQALFSEPALQKGLALSFTVDRAVPQVVVGDPGRIRQILLNLIGNAVKFTEEGGIKVAAGLIEIDKGQQIRFTVTDTGPGIQPEDQTRIFGEFYQADVSLTRAHGGTGLGLAITDQLVRLMGGRVGFESESGKGSLFWVELPLVLPGDDTVAGLQDNVAENISKDKESARLERLTNPAASASAPTAGATEYPLPVTYDLRVLVAEDSEVNQFIIRELLAKWGIEIAVAANGLDAVKAFSEQEFDLILMDIQMPEMDGLEATRQIRAVQAAEGLHKDCEIVGLSAHAMSGDRERYMAEGMIEYLTKPIRTEELREVLDACLEAKQGGS
jgi:signal transduction histidine kinase/ActR/RegA family two-component response regulator